jgi:Spy/CpxP family protein refolding chaperone
MNTRTVLSAATAVLAVTMVMAAASPARADRDDWRWHRHEWREHEWREHHWHPAYRPYVIAPPPPVYYAPPAYYGYGW